MIVEIFLCTLSVGLIYLLIDSFVKYKELRDTGVGHLKPVLIFGNIFGFITGREHLGTLLKKISDAYPDDRYVAFLEFTKCSMIIKDLNLVKNVTVKDFDTFHDVPQKVDKNVDPIFGRLLRILRGQQWRQMRSTVRPIFTGAKVKNMFSFMTECSTDVVEYYEKEIKKTNQNNLSIEIELSDLASRYTLDVLASSAFSFNLNSFTERDNEFYKLATLIAKQDLWFLLKFTAFTLFPDLMKTLGIRLLHNKAVNYFKKLLLESLEFRQETGEHRPDLIHLLIEAKQGTLKKEELEEKSENFALTTESSPETSSIIKWSDDDLIAQAITFIIAGFGTSSQTLSFLIYELALNLEIQDKLKGEIETVLLKSEGKVHYSDITQMKYMDMVVSEALRKWPPVPFTNREAGKSYKLGPVNDKNPYSFEVQKGDSIWISMYAIQRDPKHWVNPDTFDPERFSEENKPQIKPFSFIPFGAGPRNCIGSRFALLEIKTTVFFLLAKFSFEPCPRTTIPIQLKKNSFFMESAEEIWVKMKLRKKSRLNMDL